MGRVSTSLSLLLAFLGVAVAGCAEEGAPAEQDDGFDEFTLEATEETGIIRGVVVDETVTPVAGATIEIPSEGLSTTTSANGAFGFADLDPGVYQLRVDALGFAPTQTNAEVEAGVDKPEIVRVLLTKDASELPYVEAFTFNGFIQCSGSTPAYRVAYCGAVNLVFEIAGQEPPLQDEFIAGFDIDTHPDFIQSEMVWDSTQPLGEEMLLTVEVDPSDGNSIGTVSGQSPLILRADNATIAAAGMDTSGYMQQRVFNFEHPATTPPVPVCGVPNPVHGGDMCVKGFGMTIDQKFEVFTHNFHGFLPTDEWTFLDDGSPTPP